MTRSTFSQPPSAPLLASVGQPEWHVYTECAAAAVWTTPADLARFLRALLVSGLGLFVRGPRFMNLGGVAKGFSALTGSTEDATGAVVMTAGCRSPFAIRALLELGDAEGWTDLRTARRGVKRGVSDMLLRALS